MKNPILTHTRSLYLYLLTWLIISVAHTGVLFRFYKLDFFIALADGFVYNLLFGVFAISFWYAVRYMSIEKRNPLILLLTHIIAAKIVVLLWISSANYLLTMLTGENIGYRDFVIASMPWRAISGLFYYFIIILIYYLFMYYASFKEKLLREANLKTLVRETELSLLRSQLNPHFIFNSLNSISSLTLSDPARAQDMLIRLSSYLRYALEDQKSKLINFREEMENSMLYLEIEKTRFGERLIFEKEEGLLTGQETVPNMILQPLLENAIKHGVHESTASVVLHLHCFMEQNFLCIRISNNFDPASLPRRGKGIGLHNVQERLFLIYGKKDLMKIHKTENMFEVSLYIPQNIG